MLGLGNNELNAFVYMAHTIHSKLNGEQKPVIG